MKRLLLLVAMLGCVAVATAQVKARAPYVNFTVLADQADCLYKIGQEPRLELYAKAGGTGLDGVMVSYEAGNDRMEADLKGTTVFRHGKAHVPVGTMTTPGFRFCTIRFEVKGESYTETVKVGFDVNDIEPTINNPLDFTFFWEQSIKKARAVTSPIKVTPITNPAFTNDRFTTTMVRIPCDEEGGSIYGYVTIPNDGAKHPVLFVPPGAGVKHIDPSTSYAEEGFITFTMEIHGLPINAPKEEIEAAKERIGEYWYTHIEERNDYYYRRVYVGCVKAIDYLMTLPEWDGKNVGVTGGSQGGALSIITAALHPEVDFVAAFYPALSDVSGYQVGRAGGWPRMFVHSGDHPEINHKKALRVMGYYDVVNFARRVKCPGFYNYGFNDNTCPPTSVRAALNVITAPKKIIETPASYHWRFGEVNREATEWMKSQCK
ncbi:MAG: acetylxylan esterase [Alistipes sp.]|nr:acetylxylan esterase [Alistipes sp.]